MFESVFKNLRDVLDTVEKNVDNALAGISTRPNLYSVAASYSVDGIRKLTSAAIIARGEPMAINILKLRIAKNCGNKKIDYISTIANQVSKDTLSRIKKDC